MAIEEITAAKVYYLTGVSVPSDIVNPPKGSLAIYTEGDNAGLEESYNGVAWFPREQISKGSNDKTVNATRISDIGPISQSRNRKRDALSETYARVTNGCDWTEAMNVREVTILITATGAVDGETHVDIAINAAKEVLADAWLNGLESPSDDAQLERIKIGERVKLTFAWPVTFLDALPVSMSATLTNIKMFVGAH